MKNIARICVAHFIFAGALALGQTNMPFQHPKDQIALQLGAIQMGYSVPFQLVGDPTSAQQAANALAMGRNILSATASKPAVKVQGFVSSPAIDSVEFRDQLYQAVEAVVTSPVIGSIKGSVILETGKKQSVSAKLALPPSSYTIPVPYALESASSIDAQALTNQMNSLSGSVAAVQKQSSDLSTELGSLSDDMSAVDSLTTTLSSTVSTLGNQTASISDGLSSVTGSVTTLQNQAGALTTQLESLADDVTTTQSKTASISDNLSTLTNNLTELQSQNAALKQLLMGLDVFTSVTTLAGNGRDGYVDGMGPEAEFTYPICLALDTDGNVYVTERDYDINGYRIRKITPEGEVTTLISVDDELENSYYDPSGIAVDAMGNVYVAENGYTWAEAGENFIHKIRKITPEGDVDTLMQEVYSGSSYGSYLEFIATCLGGIAVDPSGAVYVTQSILKLDEFGDATWDAGIRKILPSGELSTIVKFVFVGPPSDEGTILNNSDTADSEEVVEIEVMSFPSEIAVDANENMYLSDVYAYAYDYSLDQQIVKISKIAPSGIVSSLAEYTTRRTGDRGISSPIAVDADGNVYLACEDCRIRKVSSGGIVATVAGMNMFGEGGFVDGPGADAMFAGPSGIAVDASGNVYVADSGNNRIRKITILK